MLKQANFKIEEKVLNEYKKICIENNIKYSEMLDLVLKFIIWKNSKTDNLIYELDEHID